MIDVRLAIDSDVADVIELEHRLFSEDSGVHERYANVQWPLLHGDEDFRELLDSENAIVLLASSDGVAIGLLMGYATDSGPTRQPTRSAVLRTMYVAPSHRGAGVGSRLIEEFLVWARGAGCVEAQVNHYVANTGAGRLYERIGFEAHSLQRVLHLE